MSAVTNGEISNPYQSFISKSRYSKWIDDESRRETWEETVDRYCDFMQARMDRDYPGVYGKKFWNRARKAILNLEVMPSMRGLMSAGPALERDDLAIFNCSFIAFDDVRAFDELIFILCCGTGAGFSVEEKYTAQLPVIASTMERIDDVVVVEDSKEGWANAYRTYLDYLYRGQIPALDITQVRPSGARLKTFGGRASGPQPFVDLIDFTIEKFKGATGRRLKPVEVHDIACKIGDIVVSGGVRRSALISLSDINDYDMSKAKAGAWWESNPQRALANNSAVYETKPSIGAFLQEWGALYESKSGERGIFNKAQAHRGANNRRDWKKTAGTNPCGEILLRSSGLCVGPETPIITKSGIYNISDLEDQQVSVWNGERWSPVTVRNTRTNSKMVRVTFSDGSYLDTTPDHRFSVKNRFETTYREVEAQNLIEKYVVHAEPTTIESVGGVPVENAYTLGFAVGDGCADGDQVYIDLYGEKDWTCPVVGRRRASYLPPGYSVERVRVFTDIKPETLKDLRLDGIREIAAWRREDALAFFAGLADADGSMANSGIRIYISGEKRARDAQLVLTKFGVRSSVNLYQRAGTVTNKGVRSKDLWYLQITDAREIPCHRLNTSSGAPARFKGKYQTVRSVEEIENSDAFCFTEYDRNMAVFGNVLTYQCNLTEVVIREDDNLEKLLDKIEIATALGTIQSTFTDFRYIRDVWRENAEEERLLGVSLTGIFDNTLTNGGQGKRALKNALNEMRAHSIHINKDLAEKMGINQSAAITCVKPSGTVSQLTDAASGIHPRHSDYYIRSVRGNNSDPLTEFLKQSGVPWEADVMKPDYTTVFYFPVKSPEGSVTRDEVSALDHLDLWLMYKKYWTEHNPSVTISVKESEWIEVANWVYDHWEDVGGLSFLPYSDHTYKQAPYQEVDSAGFQQFLLEFPQPDRIEWEDLGLFEHDDTTSGSQTLSCTAGNCELVDIST